MTRIDFYILSSADIQVRFDFSCKLAAKAVGLGHRVYIYCNNQSDALSVKHSLDTAEPLRFLPNVILDSPHPNTEQALPPIQIGYGECIADHHDIMINVSASKPSFFAMFDRLSEIVIQEDAILQSTRESYRFYQSRNYPLHRHDLR